MDRINPESEIFSEVGDTVNIHELMNLHHQIKERIPRTSTSKEIAKIWYESGLMAAKRASNNQLEEASMFMAHLYDRDNFDYLEALIFAFVKNEKYREAVDFLEKLYSLAHEGNNHRFWECLISVLPVGRLLVFVHSNKAEHLDKFVSELDLDHNNPMTWMTIGYTLKTHDLPILANQALDNALALRYFPK